MNTEAFSATLWVTPPPPVSPIVVQKQVIPPLKLQLLGISRDTPIPGEPSVLRAALFDPDSDRLLIVSAGEKITTKGSVVLTVASLTVDAIEIFDGESTRKLSLKEDRRPGT
ncbi:MAG: hypothetical protein AABZ53_05230 [Planctomycetota bacterium]